MVLRICALLLLLALAAVAPAVPAETMSDREVVGHSDVIIVGTVKTAEPTINGMGQAWIAVQRVIKGKPTTDVTVEYPLPTKDNAAGWGIALKPGDIDVFCLQRDAVGCYALTFSRSVMPAAMSDTIDQAVKDFPIEAVLIAPPGPIVFNQPVAMTLRVTNNGENPLVVTALEIAAFMTAPVGTNAVLTREIPVDVPRAKGGNLRDRTPAVLLQIPEGETAETTISATFTAPPNFVMPAGPAPVRFRGKVYLDRPTIPGGIVRLIMNFTTFTDWQDGKLQKAP